MVRNSNSAAGSDGAANTNGYTKIGQETKDMVPVCANCYANK